MCAANTNLVSVIICAVEVVLQSDEFKNGDSLRLFHGRGESYEALTWINIDFFDPVIVIVLYQHADESWLIQLTQSLKEVVHSPDKKSLTVLVQRRYLPKSPFSKLNGGWPHEIFAKRKGLKFKLSVTQQNIGFFLDIEPARIWLEKSCHGKRVLNLFSYTCAFSVVAMHSGAHSVVNIDLSRRSLNTGKENHLHNELSIDHVSFFAHDIFKSWGKLKKRGPYDIVVVDPPSFQKGSFIARTDYPKLLRRLESLISNGGYALVCLNEPSVNKEIFRDDCSKILNQFVFDQALPTSNFFPEKDVSRGLKLNVFRKL